MTLTFTQQVDCHAGHHCKADMYMDLYSAMFLYIQGAQTWITQFYLQTTRCLPWFPSRRAPPPFGWYSLYRPTEGRRLSRPGRPSIIKKRASPQTTCRRSKFCTTDKWAVSTELT